MNGRCRCCCCWSALLLLRRLRCGREHFARPPSMQPRHHHTSATHPTTWDTVTSHTTRGAWDRQMEKEGKKKKKKKKRRHLGALSLSDWRGDSDLPCCIWTLQCRHFSECSVACCGAASPGAWMIPQIGSAIVVRRMNCASSPTAPLHQRQPHCTRGGGPPCTAPRRDTRKEAIAARCGLERWTTARTADRLRRLSPHCAEPFALHACACAHLVALHHLHCAITSLATLHSPRI